MPTVSMTAAWVERIRVESGREIFHDERCTGLGLRVSFTGKKVWQVLYRVKGDPTKHRFDLGEFPAVTLSEAREAARAILVQADRGVDPRVGKREREEALTFKELAAEYIERWAKVKKRSWHKDQLAIEKDLLPRWGKLKAIDIKRRDVHAMLDDIVNRGSPIQANRTLALARKIFNWALDRELVETNPCLRLSRPSSENKRERVLSDDEIRAFWTACDNLEPLVAATFRLRLITAQRGGEVQHMRWNDLDFEAKWWNIPTDFTKNKLPHRVPLTEPAIAILEELKKTASDPVWVFPSRMRKGTPLANPHSSSKRLREEARLEFKLHDLRRTASTRMASLGVPRLTVSRVLNHTEGGVTSIYDRYSYDGEKRQALETWGKELVRILDAKNSSSRPIRR